MELREVKVNIWKKWRRRSDKITTTNTEKISKPMEDIWLEKLEETVERMRLEVEKRNSAKIIEEKRRRKTLTRYEDQARKTTQRRARQS